MPADTLAAKSRRATMALGRTCDGHCTFCAQDGLEPAGLDPATALRNLEDARASGAEGVTFVGGEPVLSTELTGWVERARGLGFRRVGVQTNGWALATPERMRALVEAGLTDLHLSLHGAEARVHDWHAGRAGAFDAAMRTLIGARAEGLDVAVTTVLTRSNFRVLAALPALLASRGACAWCIQVVRWRGRAAARADGIVPRLALALPFAMHALDAAQVLGLPSFVRGAPLCLLGPFAKRAIEPDHDDARAFGEACGACPARTRCSGVDTEYLARFGEGELAPRAVVEPSEGTARSKRADPNTNEGPESLRAMFVGVGETAPPSASPALAERPDRVRARLPVLGRPAPALREVAASSPKQSGEALRAILPALFEDASTAGTRRTP
jgi:hypothetical protein